MTFKALLATKDSEKISTDLVELEEKDLMPGDVTIAVDYSTVNYKDGLALTGRAPIIRTFPLILGIDLSGTVQASAYSGIEVGDRVVANGWGLSQTHNGGYAQKARMRGDWLVKIPTPLSSRDAMATLGYRIHPGWRSRPSAPLLRRQARVREASRLRLRQRQSLDRGCASRRNKYDLPGSPERRQVRWR
jgi:NADPH:quinone reductase-like Zn-dependent oxidoreductase